jgi:hemoglobin
MISGKIKIFFIIGFLTYLFVSTQTVLAQVDTDQKTHSLYERLGGLASIAVVAYDLVEAIGGDSLISLNPDYAAARQHVQGPYLKYQFTSLLCQMTGGPCQYRGRGMKESHEHLKITEREWDRMVVIFKDILAKHHVPAKETQELLEIVGSTKADIVVSVGGK